jgi:hypothetical protein
MSIFHMNIKIISGGRSAVACAAYRSGEKLFDEEANKVQDYSQKPGVVYSEIMLPDNAPQKYANRETLWNEVQEAESRQKNAQYAREVEVALPHEMSFEQKKEALHSFIEKNFTSQGMIADMSIHSTSQDHAHIMLTTRSMDENGKWQAKRRDVYKLDEDGNKIPVLDKRTGEQKRDKKGARVWEREKVDVTDWNKRENAEKWRESWAQTCNRYLDQEHKIDHRSFERQGIIDRVPTIHEGYAARQMEERGGMSDRCEYNRQVKALNHELEQVKKEEMNLDLEAERAERAAARLKEITKGDDVDERGDLRGRTDRTNDSRSQSIERESREDNRRTPPEPSVRNGSQRTDDFRTFLSSIHSQVRTAEAGRQNRDAEQRRLAEERERATKERERADQERQRQNNREERGIVFTR